MTTRREVWHVYEGPPIDWWPWTLSAEEHLRRLADGAEGDFTGEIERSAEELRSGVLAIAARSYWEGDGLVRIGAVPDPEYLTMQPLIIIKQDNNGSTFVASRLELPWLDAYTEPKPRPPLNPQVVARRITELDQLAEKLARERRSVN